MSAAPKPTIFKTLMLDTYLVADILRSNNSTRIPVPPRPSPFRGQANLK